MAESFLNFVTDYWFWGTVGFLVGASLCLRNMVKNNCRFPVAVIAITAGIYCGLLGSRILYVLIFYPDLFSENLLLALAFWQETGTWIGGPILGPVGVFIVLRIAGKPFWTNLGSIAPGLALAHAISRIGCLFNGCCFGEPSQVPWAIHSSQLNTMVHPTQIYSMMGEIVSFVILQMLWKVPERRKYLFPLYLILFSFHRFFSDFFRGSDFGPELIPGLRMFQTICVLIFILSFCTIIVLKWKKRGAILAVLTLLLFGVAGVILRQTEEPKYSMGKENSNLYLVVTRDMFADRLAAWTRERKKDGFNVVIKGWQNAPQTNEIKTWIKEQVIKSNTLCSYILIVGDSIGDNDKITRWHIPSIKQVIQYDQKSITYITDALYGDLNEDGCPEVSVGRLAVQNTIELKKQINKILRYKYQPSGQDWLRAVVWMGAKGYTSRMTEMATSLTQKLPEWIDLFLISADPRSAYSGYPPDQPAVFLEQLNRPAFLSIVVSHGSFRSITPTIYNGKEIFLSVDDVGSLTSQYPSGAMFLLGCDSGRYNMPISSGLSLTEAFSNHPGGPINVIAATGATNPLTNYFYVTAIIDQLNNKLGTTGNFLLSIQQALFLKGRHTFVELAQNDHLAQYLMQAVPENEKFLLFIPKLFQHEILMYNILGDPSCKLNLSESMPIK